jgi:predicted dienelactone hydrolase
VIFTHGYTGTFTDYTFLLEDLASRGYIAVSVDHTFEATAVNFPDGRFVKSMFGSHLAGDSLRTDHEGYELALTTRVKDLAFVVDQLAIMNATYRSAFAARLDMSKVAIAGHSFGGLTALLTAQRDSRIKAAVLLDASLSDTSIKPLLKPLLLLGAGREQWSDAECSVWTHVHGPRLAVNLRRAEHVTPSDAVWIAAGAINTGSAGPWQTVANIRDYVAGFLDANLRSESVGGTLSTLPADHPNVDVWTGNQQLCR